MNHNFRFYVKTRYIVGLSVQDIHNEFVASHGVTNPNELFVVGLQISGVGALSWKRERAQVGVF